MKLALIVSLLVTSLALNAQTLQGKVVRVADGDAITILDDAKVQSKMRDWLDERITGTFLVNFYLVGKKDVHMCVCAALVATSALWYNVHVKREEVVFEASDRIEIDYRRQRLRNCRVFRFIA